MKYARGKRRAVCLNVKSSGSFFNETKEKQFGMFALTFSRGGVYCCCRLSECWGARMEIGWQNRVIRANNWREIHALCSASYCRSVGLKETSEVDVEPEEEQRCVSSCAFNGV